MKHPSFFARPVKILVNAVGVFLPLVALAQGRGLQNPVGCNDLAGCIQRFINYVLILAGVLALGGIVYGGFLYIFSAGEESRIQQGKNAVTYSIIGLVVIGLSYAILKFIFQGLGGRAGPGVVNP